MVSIASDVVEGSACATDALGKNRDWTRCGYPDLDMVSAALQAPTIEPIVLEFFNPEAMEKTVQRGHFEHSLDGPGPFHGKVVHAKNDHVRIDWGRYNLPILARGPFAPDRVTFGALLNEKENSLVNALTLPPGSALLFREGEELNTRLTPSSNWLTVQFDRQRLEKIGLGLSNRSLDVWKPDIESERVLRAGILASLHALEATTHPAGEVDLRAANQSITDIDDYVVLLLASLLRFKRVFPRIDYIGGRNEAIRIVREAMDYMQSNIDSPITISEICAALPTNIKALERAFLHTYGIGPKQYLLRYRLTSLRRMLLRPSSGDRVLTEAYLACGLPHFSRAAQRYKELFGELPSLTLSRSHD